jgi:hypothetical protein
MQTRCPKCSTTVRSNGKDWEILNSACSELAGTEWKDNPEFCPTLSHVVEPDVLLPGITSRALVQEKIERLRIVAVNRPLPPLGSSPHDMGS